MKLTDALLLLASSLALHAIPTLATPASCRVSSVSSCSKAIQSTKTRTLSLTSWCSSVLGCVKTTTTITGDPVTVTETIVISETYTDSYIESETTTTTTFDYTETSYTEVATETVTPTWTVEKFVITTKAPSRRDVEEKMHPRDFIGKRAGTTSICPATVESKACSCLIGGCGPPITKDNRKTIKEKVTEYSATLLQIPITYTNTEWEPIYFTETIGLTYISTTGFLSTHTTTIKCTPSATSATSFFRLQATNAPDVDGQYYWAAPLSPRLLSFSIEAAFTPDEEAATVFSLDDEGRLITRHSNGTQYANVDHYGAFQLVHLMSRFEIRRRGYNYLRCSFNPPSGNYPGDYKELFCRAEGGFDRKVWNYCPIYDEWFNSPLVLGDFFSETSPDCYALVFLVKPICGWS
ncbi:hypothetical protein ABW19_dt0210463 [Dactylella cylindrospora]|nr:hypothetical protein ABW19_dt0210463 [Dactylella cylindrospora]